jgi:dolichol kinase
MKIHIDLEIKRQIFHIYLGLMLMLLIHRNILNSFYILLIILFGAIISLISTKVNIPVISWFLDNFERQEYRKKFPGKGTIFFFIGVYIVLRLFQKDIALASIMILTLGDSISHLIGKYFGKTKTKLSRKKLLEGTIAGIIMGFIGAILFVPYLEAFIASSIAMLFEAAEIKYLKIIDDNITVPVVAAIVIFLIRLI